MNCKGNRAKLLSEIALLFVGIFWGSSLIVVKSATTELSANALIAFRFSIAFIVLGLIFFRHLRGITLRDIGHGAIIGAFLFGAYWIQTLGVTLGMPGKSAFLSSIYCVMVPFVHWLVSRVRPQRRNIIAAVICTAGITIVSAGDGLSMQLGDLLALLSGLFYALHIASVDKFARGDDPIRSTIMQFAFCAFYAWCMTFALDGLSLKLVPDIWPDLLYLSLVCTALSLLLQNVGQKHADPNLAAILMSTESVFAALFSVLFTDEVFSGKMFVGFALIFAAVLVSEVSPRKKTN